MDKKVKAELAFVFSQLYEDQLLMVPDDFRQEVLIDFDEEHFAKFDEEKPFTEQELAEETLEILAEIFKDEE